MTKRIIASMLMMVMLLVLLPANDVQAALYQKGSNGGKVWNLQRNLTFLGFSTKGVDGSFGNNTKNAVIKLQNQLHLEATGKVDDELYALIEDTVYDIQLYMKQKGYYTSTVDGISGTNTSNAMKVYQKANGYAKTGVVEASYLKKMLEDSTVKQHLGALEEYVARMEGTYVEKIYDEKYWEAYGAYAQQKMDELLERLGVEDEKTVYFTIKQEACAKERTSPHGCPKCDVYNIMTYKDGWFQREFGVIDYEYLPDHTYQKGTRSTGGQSCFGWANFAMWYVFQTTDSPDVRAEQVNSGYFNKKFIQSNVKPGDILRLDYGHSVLVYAINENNIEVIDSNYGNMPHCVVQKRVMPYVGDHYSGKIVCIDRVKYFDDSLLNTSKIYTTTDASILNDDRYQIIKTEDIFEYGYQEKEYTTDTISVKDGWVLENEATEGSVIVDWTEQELIAGEGEEVTTRQVEKVTTKDVYQYSNYYWYTTSGATNLSSRDWAEKYGRSYNKTVTNAWDYSGLSKNNYKYNVLYSKEYETPLEEITAPGGTPYVDENGFQWWQEDKKTVTTTVIVTEYRKLVNVTSYQFYRWTEVKGWRAESPYAETNMCKPVTRTVTIYYYIEK